MEMEKLLSVKHDFEVVLELSQPVTQQLNLLQEEATSQFQSTTQQLQFVTTTEQSLVGQRQQQQTAMQRTSGTATTREQCCDSSCESGEVDC